MPRALDYQRPRRGFAMIEALIALLLFSLGVLGLVGLQASLTKATSQSRFRAEAAYLAQDLFGIMWADSSNLLAYNNCTAQTRCKAWSDKVGAVLPSANVEIHYCSETDTAAACKDDGGNPAPGRVTVLIEWTAAGEGRHQFTTSSSINPNPPPGP